MYRAWGLQKYGFSFLETCMQSRGGAGSQMWNLRRMSVLQYVVGGRNRLYVYLDL